MPELLIAAATAAIALAALAIALHAEMRATRIERRALVDWRFEVDPAAPGVLVLRNIGTGNADDVAVSGLMVAVYEPLFPIAPSGGSLEIRLANPRDAARLPSDATVLWSTRSRRVTARTRQSREVSLLAAKRDAAAWSAPRDGA